MKNLTSTVGKLGFRGAGVVLVSMLLGVGCVNAETFQHDGSTATIQQSGGSDKSKSRVTLYRDGQKIITRDGNSTDITVQRGSRFMRPDYDGEPPEVSIDWFGRGLTDKHFPRFGLDSRDDTDYSRGRILQTRDDFKQRMFGRMRRNFLP